MHILLAPDKYKGSLDALAIAEAMAQGVALVSPTIGVTLLPLADGGDGTEAILRHHLQGQRITCQVHDPLMRPIEAGYTLSGDGRTAIIEMAQASGLALLSEKERDCLHTSSYGTGELMAHAIAKGAEHILLGIGGSATCDGGLGMAAALGIDLLDRKGQPLAPVGRNLAHLHQLRWPSQPSWQGVRIKVACDVTNPLLGPEGAAPVYGPQKGATPEAVAQLDAGLARLDQLWQQQRGQSFAPIPGAGAAGGLGAGLMAFVDAELVSGIELVMREANFERHLAQADLILTGEGRLDGQTLAGKVIQGVCQLAQAHHCPVIALCGAVDLSPAQQRELGLTHAAAIPPGPVSLAQALDQAHAYVVRETFSVVNLVAHLQHE